MANNRKSSDCTCEKCRRESRIPNIGQHCTVVMGSRRKGEVGTVVDTEVVTPSLVFVTLQFEGSGDRESYNSASVKVTS